jgi:hypothetical protein
MELSESQLFLVGLIASGLAALLRLLTAKFANFEIGKLGMTIIVGVIALVTAVLFSVPQLPVYVDPLQYLGEWLALATVYVGSATVIYNIVLDKVLDAIKLNTERFIEG